MAKYVKIASLPSPALVVPDTSDYEAIVQAELEKWQAELARLEEESRKAAEEARLAAEKAEAERKVRL